ncbi:MAG: insulinase family protein [Bacteriovoracaceae bacterium]
MQNRFLFFFLLIILSLNSYASLSEKIEKFVWDDLEVVWIKDNRFPTYALTVYFADGALSDNPAFMGETEMMFNLLTSGSNKYSQKQISDTLDFYGASIDTQVTHEYSSMEVSGLVKDVVPTMQMVCHLFNNANYPNNEIKNYKEHSLSALDGIVINHSALANRIFREVSLENTPIVRPTEGYKATIKKIMQSHLRQKLDYFNRQVSKRVYLVGPDTLDVVKKVLLDDCGWSGMSKKEMFKRTVEIKKNEESGEQIIYLVPVPNANQAQIRIGQFLTKSEASEENLMQLSASFLGGGFSSKLMQELRVKRGLTYSASAYASAQKNYGRSGISTFTKNETIKEAFNTIKLVLDDVSRGKFLEDEFQLVKYLAEVIYLDMNKMVIL